MDASTREMSSKYSQFEQDPFTNRENRHALWGCGLHPIRRRFSTTPTPAASIEFTLSNLSRFLFLMQSAFVDVHVGFLFSRGQDDGVRNAHGLHMPSMSRARPGIS